MRSLGILTAMPALSRINRALQQIPSRAERQKGRQLHQTFVDCGVAEVIDVPDHQILYGRRGTGKTHAFGYLALEAISRGDIAVKIDFRTVGSPNGILDTGSASAVQRATRLLIDLLAEIRESLLDAVLANEELVEDGQFISRLDELFSAITNVKVSGDVELSAESEVMQSNASRASLGASLAPHLGFNASVAAVNGLEDRQNLKEVRRGPEQPSINFGHVARAFRKLADTLTSRRIWLLLDEWSNVPLDLQPYLSEFIVRCISPLTCFTVKIAAIEQQTRFRTMVDDRQVGLELGADAGANVNLDDFMVYEGNEERSREFFLGLFYKHLSEGPDGVGVSSIAVPDDLIRLGFTEKSTFNELVRAAEGVPRDALYIAQRAARRAGTEKISMSLVRGAARDWYQDDKARAVEANPQAQQLLQWIIRDVIREKRARAFLVDEKYTRDTLLLALFEARVLHLVRHGYSAKDIPGERYDVWMIDYGSYVDLLQTKYAPMAFLQFGDEDRDSEELVLDMVVPTQDLRPMRRAILDLDVFYAWYKSRRAGQSDIAAWSTTV